MHRASTVVGAELGDDVVAVPNPVTEEPPPDRYCDLVLTGGVASGVVYPWAIVELARHFRFRNIGGTSVGAMAAALAAASEYGRRCGAPAPFEVLRRLPGELAKPVGGGRTRLLALFQPAPAGRRLFALLVDAIGLFAREPEAPAKGGTKQKNPPAAGPQWPTWRKLLWLLRRVLRAFRREVLIGALAGASAGAVLSAPAAWHHLPHGVFLYGAHGLVTLCLSVGALIGLLLGLRHDLLAGVIRQDLGLVRGGPVEGHDPRNDPGLVAWLHEGIQRAAGLHPDNPRDPPLTFRDLWLAPDPAGSADTCPEQSRDPPRRARAINLEMVTTNVTHGRPYRLPLDDETSRLFYLRSELALFFPVSVMDALDRVSLPYRPRSVSDPPASGFEAFRELPGADLPIVVAARLSLSFPLLFAAIPLYAIDYDVPRPSAADSAAKRTLRRCRFSDGGLCSNFPIHLFDSPAPRWPTFGMWLDRRNPNHPEESVWLPRHHLHGRGDTWNRFESGEPSAGNQPRFSTLIGFLLGLGSSAKDWSDRAAMRMPHVRNRVARLMLRPGEGGLNIAMRRETILRMAAEYGTRTGELFVRRFVPRRRLATARAWREHQWVRLHTLLFSLREFLRGVGAGSRNQRYSVPLRDLIDRYTQRAGAPTQGTPLHRSPQGDDDPLAESLRPEQAEALKRMLDSALALEKVLCDQTDPSPYRLVPTAELRVRPPV